MSESKVKEEAEKKAKSDKKLAELKKIYVVRSFKTTSESFKFMKRIAKVITQLPNLDDMKDESVLELFNVFDDKTVKYVVETYILKRGEDGEKNKKIDYESEFIGDFENLIVLFVMAIQHLIGKVNGEGKSKEAPANNKVIKTKKR